MRPLALAPLCLIVTQVACGPSRAPGRPPGPSTVPIASAAPTGTPASSPALTGPPAAPGGAFAPSALTELAQGIREIAFAALDGRPLPQGSIPVEPSRDRSRLVRSEKPAPASRDLDVLAFAMEITLVLRESASSSGGEQERGSIEAIAFLSRTGLKVAGLKAGGPRRPHPLPPWLAGVDRFGSDVMTALRGRSMAALLVGEGERPVLNDDFLYRRLMDERPKLEQLQEAEELATRHSRVVGYKLDDVFLLARDGKGALWGLQLEIDESDGQLMLDGSPLVKVEGFDRERQRLELPEPPPPPPSP